MCQQGDALLKSHLDAILEWVKLSRRLMREYYAGNAQTALRLLFEAEEARSKTEQARAVYRSHIADHAC
jgi:hypothetical protein